MAEGLSVATANALLASSTLFGGTLWMQKHVGPPGPDGTSYVAADSARVNVSSAFGSPSGGGVVNTADIVWSSVSADETYTHFSVWSASSGGTFRFSGRLDANPATAGSPWTLPAGACAVSLQVAS